MPVTSMICDMLGPYYLRDIHVYNHAKKSHFSTAPV